MRLADHDAMPPVFSVITPTYNRRHTLQAAYEGLLRQTLGDFEWIIVDDGSTDETANLVRSWSAPFPIVYQYKANGGKASAVNHALSLIKGDYFVVLGSDDVPVHNALEVFASEFERAGSQIEIIGALAVYPSGEVIGTRLSSPTEDTTILHAYRGGMRGDKWFAFRRELAETYRFPCFDDEKYVPESLVNFRMSRSGVRTRFIDVPLLVHDYFDDGISRHILSVKRRNPHSYIALYGETITADDAALLPLYLKAAANVFSMLLLVSKRPLTTAVLLVLSFPLGLAKGALDRMRLRARVEEKNGTESGS